MPRTDPSTSAAPPGLWVGWAVFAAVTLVGFCFGVWAGTQKPERAAVAQGPAATPPKDDPPPPKPEPVKADAPPEPKSAPAAKAEPAKAPPPKKEPAAPKPEPKPAADPKPPAKPPEPKKPDPKPPEPKKPAAPAVTFARDVVPVFRAHCLNCHGGVGAPKGGLDLRTLAAAVKGGDGGPGVKPNDPDSSPVWTSIDGGMMPPDGKPRLSEKEKKVIRDWIDGGAK